MRRRLLFLALASLPLAGCGPLGPAVVPPRAQTVAPPPSRQAATPTLAPAPAPTTAPDLARNLGSIGAQLDVPHGWTLRANGGGFFLDDEGGINRLVIRVEPSDHDVFDRLPRSGPGVTTTEHVLGSGARYYRRSDDEGVAIFVDLSVGSGRSLVCACEPELEQVCVSLRPSAPHD